MKYNNSQTKKNPVIVKSKKQIPQYLALGVIILITIIIFFNAKNNGFVNYDDEIYIKDNPFIKNLSWQGIENIFSSYYYSNYHPLTTLSYLFEYRFRGLNPAPYHINNIILHLINTILVFFLSRLLFRNVNISLIISFLFTVHPMHTESVAWISERKDVLYSLFFLLSLIFYILYVNKNFKIKYLSLSFICFVFSVFSKSMAITLPMVLFLIDFFYSRKFNIKMILEKLLFILISLVFIYITLQSQKITYSADFTPHYPFYYRLFFATYSTLFYIFSAIIPVHLSAFHPFPVTEAQSLPVYYYLSPLIIILLLWLIFRFFKSDKVMLTGILFFIITISLVIQIFPVGNAMIAERYTYVPYIGLFFIFGNFINNIINDKIKSLIRYKIILYLIFGAFGVYYCVYSYNRVKIWNNSISLWEDALRKYPESSYGFYSLGNAKMALSDYNGAIQDFGIALKLNPDFAWAYNNRGYAMSKINKIQEAMQNYETAIRKKPDFEKAYFNRGTIWSDLKNYENAINDYSRAIELKPAYLEAYLNRGMARCKTGDFNGALEDFNIVLQMDSCNASVYENRGNIKGFLKDFQGSISDFNEAIRLTPDDASSYLNRAISKINIKDTAGACEDLTIAENLGNIQAKEMFNSLCK